MPRAFERPATIGLSDDGVLPGAALEGLLIPTSELPDCSGALVAPPHPLMGGSMDSPVVTELAHAFEKAGTTSLRFNWRGVGGSAGQPSGELADAQLDWAAGWDFLAESVEGPMTGAGYSFGAVTALVAAARRPRPRRLVLVAPPPRLMPVDAIDGFEGPIFILVGNRDRFIEVDDLRALADARGNVTLAVIEGADHFFMTHLSELRHQLDAWLEVPGEGVRTA